MVRKKHCRDIERFQKCRQCGGTNTDAVGIAESSTVLAFIGWCWSCRRDFIYSVPIEIVHDRQGRI